MCAPISDARNHEVGKGAPQSLLRTRVSHVRDGAADRKAMPVDPHERDAEPIDSLLDIARRLARRWCTNSADADDVAQESVLRLWTCRDPPRNPVPWLAVVTRRLCNRERVRCEVRGRAEEVFTRSHAPAPASLHDLLLDLDQIIDRLSERDRRLLLYLTEGYQTREIASAFDCAPGDVGQMVARVRSKARRLRDRLRSDVSETAAGAAPRSGPKNEREGRCSHPIRTPDPSLK